VSEHFGAATSQMQQSGAICSIDIGTADLASRFGCKKVRITLGTDCTVPPAQCCLKGGCKQARFCSILGLNILRTPPPAYHTGRISQLLAANVCVMCFLEPVIALLTPMEASRCDAFSPGCGQRGISVPCASRDKRKSLEQSAYCTCMKLIKRCRARALGRTISPRVLQ